MPPTPSRHDTSARPPGPAVGPGAGRPRARTTPPRPVVGAARPAPPSYARRLAAVVLLAALPLAG
ncbi:hypothetical protein AB0G13_17350, partial [Micromonospora sp. NPDC023633]